MAINARVARWTSARGLAVRHIFYGVSFRSSRIREIQRARCRDRSFAARMHEVLRERDRIARLLASENLTHVQCLLPYTDVVQVDAAGTLRACSAHALSPALSTDPDGMDFHASTVVTVMKASTFPIWVLRSARMYGTRRRVWSGSPL